MIGNFLVLLLGLILIINGYNALKTKEPMGLYMFLCGFVLTFGSLLTLLVLEILKQ